MSNALAEVTAHARRELAKAIVGQQESLDLLLLTVVCGGHALSKAYPAWPRRWRSARCAQLLQARFQRVQCTPDLMPGRHHRRQHLQHGDERSSSCTAVRCSPICCSSTRSTACRRGRRRRCSRRWRSGR